MIYKAIQGLISHAINSNLITEDDEYVVRNQIMDILKLTEWHDSEALTGNIEQLLEPVIRYAVQNGIIEDTAVQRDLFDTKIMGVFTPMPREVNAVFRQKYAESPETATDWYYDFSKKLNYVRAERIAKDMKWTADTEYGTLDVTINLSKPEKDPKAIAAARNAKQSAYPKCQLCVENEGYEGRLDHPARETHRIIPITIDGGRWGFQYSPYVYYNEHCIVLNSEHTPMKIDESAFRKLFDFIKLFPHYFIGSNADLPIVGGSILTHEHFQGGHYEFAMERAKIRQEITIKGYEDVKAGIVNWPMSVIRINHSDSERLVKLAAHILDTWRAYTDEDVFIFAETDGEPHNTITPIARMRGGQYELDLVLRNNITTEEQPLGVYHPHKELHHIKKENIGLIEVMGLAVLPARLKNEMKKLGEYIAGGKDIRSDAELEKHADWVEEFKPGYDKIDENNVEEILKKEIGIVFKKVLEHAGVFKNDDKGTKAFLKFIETL